MIKAWSFSRYNTYKQCPLKAKLQFIDKIVAPPSEPMARGSKIHDIAEQYLTLPARRLVPDELIMFANLFRTLRKKARQISTTMIVEEMWCFRKDWTETHTKDYSGCWLRVKLDTAWFEDKETMIVNDWKTGKYRPDNQGDYMEQLELYALAALLKFPEVEVVKPRLSYIDHGITYPDVPIQYTREGLPVLQEMWEERTEPMLNDTDFSPRPNMFCNWCHYRKSNKADGGGQCKF